MRGRKMRVAGQRVSRETKPYRDMSRFYLLEPDYGREIFEVSRACKEKLFERLTFLYGKELAEEYLAEVERLMKVHYAHKPPEMIEKEKDFDPTKRFSEKDVILIAYGDLIQSEDHLPLETLADFSKRFLKGAINTIHILPFFPYSSDRGFAIIDFEEVDPRLGTWEDIAVLKEDFKLMFDGVFNHISSKSRWFQEFLNANSQFQDFFIVFSTKEAISEDHLKLILRPRTSDLLTQFNTLNGKRSIWTTFSTDQIDLNYKSPRVLMKMIDILLQYVRRGADIIRLDAVTYLWAELGTSCAHLEQTHTIIKLFRDILDTVAQSVAIITETNVPHKENIQYFGNGMDEAQMVYNFTLPPLVLHAFQNGSSSYLTKWASTLEKVSDMATYFNFLDSHDGVGLMGARGILSEEEIEVMALKTLEHGGFISYKANGDGITSPYELNITWYSALNREDVGEPIDLQVKRFLASRSIALAMMGVPGVYLHGLLGSKNDADAVLEENQTRSINRKAIDRNSLYAALNDPETSTYKIAYGLGEMIEKRTREKCFHPSAPQEVLDISDSVFSVLRTSVDGREKIFCVTNVTSNTQSLKVDANRLHVEKGMQWKDVLTEKLYEDRDGFLAVDLEPYEVLWLKGTVRLG